MPQAKFWYEVANSDSLEHLMLNTTCGQTMPIDSIRPLVYKGLSLGMLQRLHRYVIVQQAATPWLDQVL